MAERRPLVLGAGTMGVLRELGRTMGRALECRTTLDRDGFVFSL